ncbi:MAG: PilZ domain-containing protein [Pyrinomonadaceae bacterium]|nr:PilZ domain-containing protein [Pyrinomonadaceae bacterium]
MSTEVPTTAGRRTPERIKLTVPARVEGRESTSYQWAELTRLINVTAYGAAFTLSRPTEPGRLLHLTLPLPRQLRCFDYGEQQYRVWSLVRHVEAFKSSVAPPPPQAGASPQKAVDTNRFGVGVAFVGKRPPTSYLINPATRYEIGALADQKSLWQVRERTTSDATDKVAAISRRRDTRLFIPVDVTIEVLDDYGAVKVRELTVTENISRRGAAVMTTLSVDPGRFVRLSSARHQLSVVAAVRARRTGAGGIARLHLEFIDKQWPLDGLE